MSPSKIYVGQTSDVQEGQPRIVVEGEIEIGVYRVGGQLYAYHNLCAHAGGPACEGLLMPRVEEVIEEDRTYRGMRFNYDELHIVCPWHGWEYELKTGEMVGDRKFRLRKCKVFQEGEAIYVIP